MKRFFFTLFLILAPVFAPDAEAKPKYKDVLAQGKQLSSEQKKFKTNVRKLSAANRNKLRGALAALGDDSDGDGDSDLFESADGSNLCTPDHDGDGEADGDDIEAKGSIVSYEAPTLVIGTKTFVTSADTRYRGEDDEVFNEGSLVAGVCVEVKGHVDPGSGNNVADRIKKEDGCR